MRFPNESETYRIARDALLASEIALRRQMEAVAVELRALPPGGEVLNDYRFDTLDENGRPAEVNLDTLFRGSDTLMVYHYMFPRYPGDTRVGMPTGEVADWPLADQPCPSCTALIEGGTA